MRLGIAGLEHETVTFWPGLTSLQDFEREALHGSEVIERRRGTNTAVGGFIDVCEREGFELFPVCEASGGATATVSDTVYDFYVEKMKREFAKEANRLDGILLFLHGAMVTESLQDSETHVLRDIRSVVGTRMLIMVGMDLHGNLDPAILGEATAVFGFQSSPHVDAGETGRRAARTMMASLRREIKPTVAIAKPNLVVPSVFSATGTSPARDIISRLREWEERSGVVDVSAFFGFAWSDVHQVGMSMVAVTDNDPALAREITDDLAKLALDNREGLTRGENLYSVHDGIAYAVRRAERASKPIVILDHADRTNDTTFVLKELLAQNVQNAAMPLMKDPKAVKICHEAGVDKTVEVNVGAGTGWRDGGPVRVRGRVLWVGEGKYLGTGPMRKGLPIDHGPTAIVQANGIWLQLTTFGASLIDEDPITQFGRKPGDFDIIVTKSKTHFRAVYEEIGEEIVIVDAPGQCRADLSVFRYRNVPLGVYPITAR